MSNFKIKNWSKRTPKFWKRIGDTCIYSLPMLIATVMGSPLSSETKLWLCFGLNLFLVGAKAISKLTAIKEEEKQ